MAAWVALATWFRRATFNALGALGQYNVAAPAIPDGGGALLQLDVAGNLKVVPGAGALWVVVGPAAQGDPVSGNPVEISYEAEAVVNSVKFNLNVPVSEGDVVRPKASTYGVAYTSIILEDGSLAMGHADGSNYDLVNLGAGLGVTTVRRDTPASLATGTNQHQQLTSNAYGALWVALDPNTGPVYAEDSASASAEVGMLTLRVRRDAVASSAGSDGDHVWGNQDADGYDYMRNKSFDSASNADRMLPVTDLSARRTAGDAPVSLIAANLAVPASPNWADLGPEIPTMGYTRISLWLNVDINDTTNLQIRCLAKHTAASASEFAMPILKSNTGATPYNLTAEAEYIELNVDADQKIVLTWDVSNTIAYVQFQIVGTNGATPGNILATDTAVTYGWAS